MDLSHGKGGIVMKHTIVHFEIPVDDVKRAKMFYTELLGWQISGMPGYEDYWNVQLGEEGQDLAGGMMKRQVPDQGPINYVQVESVEEYAARAQQLGGTVVVPKSPVPGMGWFACCLDTEGNTFGLWENDPSAA